MIHQLAIDGRCHCGAESLLSNLTWATWVAPRIVAYEHANQCLLSMVAPPLGVSL